MTIVILAAGIARRMGSQKLLLPVAGRSIIEIVISAADRWPIVVVTGGEVAPLLGSTSLCIVRNDAPERGMAHSLALGNAVIPKGEAIAVLLGDLPEITPGAISNVIDAYDDSIDVVVPRCGDVCGHPVIFGPRARAKIAALPDGDTIRRLRDDESLRRRFVQTDQGCLIDIDTPDDYAELTRRRADVGRSSG